MTYLHRARSFGRLLAATIYNLVLGAAGVLLVAMACVLFAQVIFRYVLFKSLPWSEELARYMLVWFGLLSATAAAYTGQHFAIHVVANLLRPSVRAWLAAAVDLASGILFLVLAVLSYRYLDNIRGLHGVATGLDMRFAYGALPVSFLLLALMQMLACLGVTTARQEALSPAPQPLPAPPAGEGRP